MNDVTVTTPSNTPALKLGELAAVVAREKPPFVTIAEQARRHRESQALPARKTTRIHGTD